MRWDKQSSPSTFVELLDKLVFTKRGLIVIGCFLAAIIIFVSLIVSSLQPDKLEVTTTAGTIAIRRGSTKNAIVIVSASGNRENIKPPWTLTGIKVKKDDIINIQASGRVHTALKKLITIAETDQEIVPSWVGPNGSNTDRHEDWDSKRASYKLMPDKGLEHGYGKLIAAIWREEDAVHLKAVGESLEWKIEKEEEEGELILAVNDILLRDDARHIYALPLKDNLRYYTRRIEEEDQLRKKKVILFLVNR